MDFHITLVMPSAVLYRAPASAARIKMWPPAPYRFRTRHNMDGNRNPRKAEMPGLGHPCAAALRGPKRKPPLKQIHSELLLQNQLTWVTCRPGSHLQEPFQQRVVREPFLVCLQRFVYDDRDVCCPELRKAKDTG